MTVSTGNSVDVLMAEDGKGGWLGGGGDFSSFFEWYCRHGLMVEPDGMVGECVDFDLG